MKKHRKNQSVVISGESGAGKTESTKLVLQFLATISGQHSWIEQQVLEANPILEGKPSKLSGHPPLKKGPVAAFGNAKTVRNDNSSRFGKYIDVHFNSVGSIEGARIEKYLLEKSRIVAQSQGERNYHIFYCLLAGLSAEEKKHLELTRPSDYFYLTQGKSLEADGRDDAADLAEIRSAMKVLLFKEPEIGTIFQLLSALLHIGNVKYRGTVVDTIEGVEVSDAANVARIARLLQVSEQTLLSTLTTRTMVTREERVVMRLSSRAAVDARDALAKGIYGRLFDYIVTRINDAIYKPRSDPTHRHSIGVLDIFGFENFETNSFEQLCINYANESLQQFFVQHIFKIEQAEYDREQINWRNIKFVDNQETLEMIAVRPMNVFSLIDEESIFPKEGPNPIQGTDQSMLSKLHTNHSKGTLYLRPKSDLQRSFGVKHFAGPVFYHTKGFLEKNRDAFSADLHALVQSSKMHLLLRIFDNVDYVENGTISGTIRGKGVTVSGQFRKSLDQLMQQLNHTEPFFIRCIKPNEFKRALMMDRDLVLRQLQYSGMMETIKIRRNGYPIRHDFEPFVRRYRVLVNGIGPLHRIDVRSAAEQICEQVLGSNSEFQLGKTKVFLKEKHDLYLEQEYHRMLAFRATVIQKNVRGWLAKRSFRKKKEAATVIQKHWRRYDQQKRYNQIVAGFCRLQAVLRSRQLVLHYQTLRHNIIQFQAACRGAIVRAKIRELKRKGEQRIISVPVTLYQRIPSVCPAAAHQSRGTAGHLGTIFGTTSSLTTHQFMLASDIMSPQMRRMSLEVGQLFDFLPTDSRPETSTDNESTSSDIIPTTTAQTNGTIDACDLEKYQFGKFAATYFQSQITATHSKKPLKSPLLSHEDPGTQLAAMAVWITILRFMGDLPDVKHGSNNGEVADKTPVMSRLFETLGRKYSHKDVEEAAHADEFDAVGRTLKKSMGKKLISMTLKRKSKLSAMSSSSSDHSSESTSSSNALMENRPMTSLDKLHYIIGMGILREELRDEIYCQLCKQLTSNPSRLSAARGWILLSLCVGCFAPSERFIKYLYCFIRERGPTGAGYSAYMEERLKRTELNGCRHQPPSYIELQANKSKKPIVLAVTFMDGSVKTLCADSATTADELCTQLAQKVGLKEKFGFSLYIALFDKVSSLGSGSDHVMDAISQCEQYAKEQGRQERNAPWRLFFRKEIFTPWHDAKEDPVSTNLIYQQVVRGIKYGEYRCDKEDDLAALAAQQYFVEEGPLDVNRLESQLHNYLPDFELNGKEMARERWIQSIMYHYRRKFGVNPPSPHHVKEEVVSFAKFKWPLLFSRFYEATKFSGPPLPRNDVIVAVNWTGIYVVDDQEHVLLEFSSPEITRVLHQKGPRPGFDTCTIKTVTGDEYSFQSPNAEDVKSLVSTFIDGLKQRSRYVVATKPQRGSDSTNLLDFECGDLLVLLNKTTGKDLLTEKFVKGECARTCLQGLIQTENVYVLPTLVKPNVNTLQLFSKGEQMALDILNNNQVVVIQTNGRPHTLEQFAAANFRTPVRPPSTQRSLMTLRRRDVAPLPRWRFSREPLDVPLLKKLEGRDEQCRDAISMFVYVMKYMGDQPSRRSRLGTDLTDNIFKPAIAHFCAELLRLQRDEEGIFESIL
ncbi:myosin head [Ancylostoma duodenale]|uniref:Myosin head n=1 Tax=Ancylostoma duodenale TaxID=51022 RepID=A0A0C2GZ58_9BILA|nr:myosin head [Ancylostoma duodenale]